MSIQWNKVVTDLFGAKVPNDGVAHNRLCFGTIERGSGAWEIMRDAGRFLKNRRSPVCPPGQINQWLLRQSSAPATRKRARWPTSS
jgi:hypothetical protein